MMKREFKPRPSRHGYSDYVGELGKVVAIHENRTKSGHLRYEVECADCGKIHLRDAKHLKQGIKSAECVYYKPPNWSGLDREDAIIRRQYGISMQQFEALLAFQGGGCAICQKPIDALRRRMNIDHDHETNEVRGLLCSGCNTGLGHLGDNVEGLKRALYYLQHTPFSEFKYSLAR